MLYKTKQEKLKLFKTIYRLYLYKPETYNIINNIIHTFAQPIATWHGLVWYSYKSYNAPSKSYQAEMQYIECRKCGLNAIHEPKINIYVSAAPETDCIDRQFKSLLI